MADRMNSKRIVQHPDDGVNFSGFVDKGDGRWNGDRDAIQAAYAVESYAMLLEIRDLLRAIRYDLLGLGKEGLHYVIREEARKLRAAKRRAAKKKEL
jgi:hypothetical protein